MPVVKRAKFSPTRAKQKVQKFLWNPDRRTCCSKKPKNWLFILLLFSAFLVFVLLFFFLMLYVLSYEIGKASGPTMSKISLTKTDYGLQFIPLGSLDSPSVWIRRSDKTGKSFLGLVKEVERLLNGYKNQSTLPPCAQSPRDNNLGTRCLFGKDQLGPCATPDFGFTDLQPCIFVKLHKVQSWKPEPYLITDLPHDFPKSVLTDTHKHGPQDIAFFTCEGQKALDKEHLGEIEYYPTYKGFKAYFFPYISGEEFYSPLVAIKLKNITKDVVVSVQCKLWAGNVRTEDSRQADFQIMVSE